jgi:hypothetical protein
VMGGVEIDEREGGGGDGLVGSKGRVERTLLGG